MNRRKREWRQMPEGILNKHYSYLCNFNMNRGKNNNSSPSASSRLVYLRSSFLLFPFLAQNCKNCVRNVSMEIDFAFERRKKKRKNLFQVHNFDVNIKKGETSPNNNSGEYLFG